MWSALLPPTPEPQTPQHVGGCESLHRRPYHYDSYSTQPQESQQVSAQSLSRLKRAREEFSPSVHTSQRKTQQVPLLSAKPQLATLSGGFDPATTRSLETQCSQEVGEPPIHTTTNPPSGELSSIFSKWPDEEQLSTECCTATELQGIHAYRRLGAPNDLQSPSLPDATARNHFMRALLHLQRIFQHKASQPQQQQQHFDRLEEEEEPPQTTEVSAALLDISEFLKTSAAAFSRQTLCLMVDRLCLDRQLSYAFVRHLLVPCALHWIEFLEKNSQSPVACSTTLVNRDEQIITVFHHTLHHLSQKLDHPVTEIGHRKQHHEEVSVLWFTVHLLCKSIRPKPQYTETTEFSSMLFRLQLANVRIHRQLRLIQRAMSLIKKEETNSEEFHNHCWKARETYAARVGSQLSQIEATLLDIFFS